MAKNKFQKLAAKGAKAAGGKTHPVNSHITVKDTGPHRGDKARTQGGHMVHPPYVAR